MEAIVMLYEVWASNIIIPISLEMVFEQGSFLNYFDILKAPDHFSSCN